VHLTQHKCIANDDDDDDTHRQHDDGDDNDADNKQTSYSSDNPHFQ